MRSSRRSLGLFVAFSISCATHARAEDAPATEPPASEVETLLDRLLEPPGFGNEEALAALLKQKTDAALVETLTKRLEYESGFHQRNALGYLLAHHGERAGLEVLVASLERTGHLGYVYLTRVAPQDFGWNRDGSSLQRWRAWLEGFTAEEYRERVRRSRLSKDVRAAGRAEFEATAAALAAGGGRAEAAAAFRALAKKFPDADVASTAREVADGLDSLAKEDAAWKEPPSGKTLPPPERAAWLAHHLRDARGKARAAEGWTSVLAWAPPASARPNAARELRAMGAAAVPALLALLEDRRPIRAHASGPVVLRLQDAALEVLNEILPVPTYDRATSATYLSSEEPPQRKALIEDVRSWAAETAGKSGDDLVWIGLRRAPARKAIESLRRLAVEGKRKDAVLTELRRMYDGGRSWIFRPSIVELMADLGDTSKVREVIETLDAGEYSSHMIMEDGDTAAGINAEMTARRLKQRFPDAAKGEAEPAPREPK